MNDQIDYRAVRRRVEDGVQKQKHLTNTLLFGLSIFMFVLFMILSFAIYLGSDGVTAGGLASQASGSNGSDAAIGAMIMLSAGWFVTLIFQGISLFMNTKAGEEQLRDKVMGRELGRELLRLGMDDDQPVEKRKRMLQMADDGEMAEALSEDGAEPDSELSAMTGSSNQP